MLFLQKKQKDGRNFPTVQVFCKIGVLPSSLTFSRATHCLSFCVFLRINCFRTVPTLIFFVFQSFLTLDCFCSVILYICCCLFIPNKKAFIHLLILYLISCLVPWSFKRSFLFVSICCRFVSFRFVSFFLYFTRRCMRTNPSYVLRTEKRDS